MGLLSFLNFRKDSQNGIGKMKNHKHLALRMEPLEERQMLAVSPLSVADASAINQTYPELAVTAGMNAIEISATNMTAAALNNALLEAKGTLGENDIILIRGTGSINGTYSINIDAETEGSVLVVAMGDGSVTLNSGYAGNGQANLRIMDVSGNTNITFAGINFTNGRTTANNAGGGALYVNEGATVTLVNSEITGNVSTRQFGGAIANEGTLNIYNSLIAGNQAQVLIKVKQDGQTSFKAGYGSGIYAASESHTLLVNVTVTDNTYSVGNDHGLGIANESTDFTLVNTIVSGNADLFLGMPVGSDTFGTFTAYSSLITIPGPNNTTTFTPDSVDYITGESANFVSTSGNDAYRLAKGSSAIDAGSNSPYQVGNIDLAGNQRIWNGTVDMGAYEFRSTKPVTQFPDLDVTITPTTSDIYPGGSVQFNVIVTNNGTAPLPAGWTLSCTYKIGETVYTIDTEGFGAELAPGAIATISVSYTLPDDIPTGWFSGYVDINVLGTTDATESNEGNNSAIYTFRIGPACTLVVNNDKTGATVNFTEDVTPNFTLTFTPVDGVAVPVDVNYEYNEETGAYDLSWDNVVWAGTNVAVPGSYALTVTAEDDDEIDLEGGALTEGWTVDEVKDLGFAEENAIVVGATCVYPGQDTTVTITVKNNGNVSIPAGAQATGYVKISGTENYVQLTNPIVFDQEIGVGKTESFAFTFKVPMELVSLGATGALDLKLVLDDDADITNNTVELSNVMVGPVYNNDLAVDWTTGTATLTFSEDVTYTAVLVYTPFGGGENVVIPTTVSDNTITWDAEAAKGLGSYTLSVTNVEDKDDKGLKDTSQQINFTWLMESAVITGEVVNDQPTVVYPGDTVSIDVTLTNSGNLALSEGWEFRFDIWQYDENNEKVSLMTYGDSNVIPGGNTLAVGAADVSYTLTTAGALRDAVSAIHGEIYVTISVYDAAGDDANLVSEFDSAAFFVGPVIVADLALVEGTSVASVTFSENIKGTYTAIVTGPGIEGEQTVTLTSNGTTYSYDFSQITLPTAAGSYSYTLTITGVLDDDDNPLKSPIAEMTATWSATVVTPADLVITELVVIEDSIYHGNSATGYIKITNNGEALSDESWTFDVSIVNTTTDEKIEINTSATKEDGFPAGETTWLSGEIPHTGTLLPGSYSLVVTMYKDGQIVGTKSDDFEVFESPAIIVTTLEDIVNPYDGLISLREAIEYAWMGDLNGSIKFADNLTDGTGIAETTITLKNADSIFSITENISIDASNYTGANMIWIDAGGKSGIFNVQGGSLTLNNLGFTGGNADVGGVIDASDTTLIITDCVFSGNTAIYGGGAIRAIDSTITIDRSRFIDNTAGDGGGALALFVGDATITNSLFAGNESATVGGAIDGTFLDDGTLTLRNVTMADNKAMPNSGGAVHVQGGMTSIYNSIITDNGAGSSVLISRGGAIYGTNLIDVVNAGFVGNGNYKLRSDSVAVDTGVDAQAYGDKDLAGNERFYRRVDMGAYELQVEAAAVVVTTLGDIVDNMDGLISLREALLYASETVGMEITFKISAEDYAKYNGTITINHGTPEQRRDEAFKGLVGELLVDKSVKIVGMGKDILTISGSGGGDIATRIFYITGDDVSISDMTLADVDYANKKGGAIHTSSANLKLSDIIFENNSAGRGAGVYQVAGHTKLEDVTFTGNSAEYYGGAFYLYNGTADIRNTTFSDNTAVNGGGAITVGSSISTATKLNVHAGSSFTGNESLTGMGGAIYGTNVADITVNNVPFSGNNALQGGAIYLTNGELAVTESTFSGNTAISDGGAIYQANGTSNISGEGTLFSGNSTEAKGGAIYLAKGEMNISTGITDDSGFVGNKADRGGAIYQSNGTLTVSSTEFSANEAVNYGGAIYQLNGIAKLNNVNFLNRNYAGQGGGAISTGSQGSTSAVMEITTARFEGNESGRYGGAIYMSSNSTLDVIGASFSGNTAKTKYGSAIAKVYEAGKLSYKATSDADAKIVDAGLKSYLDENNPFFD